MRNLKELSGTLRNPQGPSVTLRNLQEHDNFNLKTHGQTYFSTSRAASLQLKRRVDLRDFTGYLENELQVKHKLENDSSCGITTGAFNYLWVFK